MVTSSTTPLSIISKLKTRPLRDLESRCEPGYIFNEYREGRTGGISEEVDYGDA